ncbi:membrane protein [Gemmatimonadetes bacterium T265]|nr:membrane protein [Gemmatimonadetes bacterium T265]
MFAVSGALAAGRKQLDLLGVLVLALVTAVGGGTLRDVLLGRNPIFWLASPRYVAAIAVAALLTVAYTRRFRPPENALLVADAVGLGAYAIVGARIAERAGLPPASAVLLGAVTGAAGGAIRDVLCAEIPYVLRRGNLYASAALAGTAAYVGLEAAGVARDAAALAGAALTILVRLGSLRWQLQLPVYRLEEPRERPLFPRHVTARVTGEHVIPGPPPAR